MDSTYVIDDENVKIIRLEDVDKRILLNNGMFCQKYFIDNKSDYYVDVFIKNFVVNGKEVIKERCLKKGAKPKQKTIGEFCLYRYDIENYVEYNEFKEYCFTVLYEINGKSISSETFCGRTITEYDY